MKVLMFTDIHWGARGNSEEHLQDCLNYIDWFCELAKKQKVDRIMFLGDWFENRNQINVRTFDAAYEGISRVNKLGIPIDFDIGNHDLYHRANREIFSTRSYSEFKNVNVVNEPQEINKQMFMCPYIFKQEYEEMAKVANNYKYVFGHFEFGGFVVTGDSKVLDHGPSHTLWFAPKYVFSGHFHKRQLKNNIVYIGNTFPTTYGDAWDEARGACLLDTSTDELRFFDWEDAPLFYQTTLSALSEHDINFKEGSRVRCVLDIESTYSDIQNIKSQFAEVFKLREFSVVESYAAKKESLTEGKEIINMDLQTLDSAIETLILKGVIELANISASKLAAIYKDLKDD